MVLPFAALLIAIAVSPLQCPHFWDKNRNKAVIAFALSLPVLLFFGLRNEFGPLLHSAREYFSFIALLASLYTVSGGIHLVGDLQGRPAVNSLFLLVGAILANFIGTTGASMLLIRPFLFSNLERQRISHLPIFFIFIVSNTGGLLTPLGDPPLFLGYLREVPFFWTLRLWPVWCLVNGLVLAVFYLWDRRAYARETIAARVEDIATAQPLWIRGRRNILLLGGILIAVFLPTPFRETLMILMGALSYFLTSAEIHEKNRFSWHPILEIAILFAGIFVTMVPALKLLETHATRFPIHHPWQFFWLTGVLSSFLDNAPTYLTFLSLAQGSHLAATEMVIGIPAAILAAISCGAVLMGANTYIGNGPNFMVKAIADQVGVKTPSFLGYMVYSVAILFPVFFIVTVVFFV